MSFERLTLSFEVASGLNSFVDVMSEGRHLENVLLLEQCLGGLYVFHAKKNDNADRSLNTPPITAMEVLQQMQPSH